MNEWLEKIHNCGFSADVMFTKDGDKMIVLHWKTTSRQLKIFRDADADYCLDSALRFAETYDAFINTSAECSK